MEKLEEKQRESLQRIKCENKRIFFFGSCNGKRRKPQRFVCFRFWIFDDNMREFYERIGKKIKPKIPCPSRIDGPSSIVDISQKYLQ